MTVTTRLHLGCAAAALLVLCAALGALAAPPADAAPRTCKARAGTVYKDGSTRIWHERRTLFACTTNTFSGKARTARLGPWTSGGRAVANGSYVTWSTRRNIDGTQVDRMWAGSVDGRRFLSGTRAIPASGTSPAQEGPVQRLLVTDHGAGWVTTTSDVVLAIGGTSDAEPASIGALPAPLVASGQTVLVGSFPGTPAAQLAATARLSYETGEMDDCGGSMTHTLLVTPSGATGPVGARWTGGAPISPEICNV